jgi:hypothetical protein
LHCIAVHQYSHSLTPTPPLSPPPHYLYPPLFTGAIIVPFVVNSDISFPTLGTILALVCGMGAFCTFCLPETAGKAMDDLGGRRRPADGLIQNRLKGGECAASSSSSSSSDTGLSVAVNVTSAM